MRLRTADIVPPGGFPYYQGGAKPYKFQAVPDAVTQAHAIANYRSANNLARSTFEESYADLIAYTCVRLGGNTRFCIDDGGVAAAPEFYSHTASDCKGCGAPVT
jgi:hypothetical protein